jgi:hypothetical protein
VASIEETQIFGAHASAMLMSAHVGREAVIEMVRHNRDAIALPDRTRSEMCDDALHLIMALDQQLLALQKCVFEVAAGE